MYSRYTWDGKEYGENDWRLRQKREPLTEIFQIKGAQECAWVSVQPMRNVLLNRFLTRAKRGRQPAVLLKPALSARVESRFGA